MPPDVEETDLAPPPGPPLPDGAEQVNAEFVIQSLQRQNAEQALTIAMKDSQIQTLLAERTQLNAQVEGMKRQVDDLAVQVQNRETRRTTAKKAGTNGKGK